MKKFKVNITTTESYSMEIEADSIEQANVLAEQLRDKTHDPAHFYYLEARDENPDWSGNDDFNISEMTIEELN